jgi:hypothetical protein
MGRSSQVFTKCLLLLAWGLLFSACGGEGESGPITSNAAGIVIESPSQGQSVGSSTVTLIGRAWRNDGGIPNDHVTWFNGGNSGSADLHTGIPCTPALCLGHFETEVPLSLGSNTITVTYRGATDSVTVSRHPLVNVSGRVALPGGAGVRDIRIQLSAVTYWRMTPSSGDYLFTGIPEGTHTITPSLIPPQSGACFSFSPSSRTITVTTADVPNQDFTATPLSSCYSIAGQITESGGTTGTTEVTLFVADMFGNQRAFHTDSTRRYTIYHLAPGTYTVTPELCNSFGSCRSFTPASRTVTITNTNVTGQDFVLN